MRESVVGLLDKADLAVAACAGVVTDDALEPVARSTRSLRLRLSYPDDLIVAALAGGTGSGKSSLLNAVVGTDVAMVGGVRPTTEEPLALVPEARAAAIAGYLDNLGVGRRELYNTIDWLCLLDLPDTDSVEVDHRFQVEALLPRLDVVVWVVDPEKYRDAALHDRYLAPLAPYSRQFVFVLNQVDRLHDEELEAVAGHFTQTLVEDGIDSPRVIPTAAAPPAGPPLGIEELLGELDLRRSEGAGLYDKLLVDLARSSSTLLEVLGHGGVDFETRGGDVVAEAAANLAQSDEGAASGRLSSFLEALAAEVGGPAAERIRELAASIPVTVHEILAEVEAPAQKPRRRRLTWSKGSGEDSSRIETLEVGLDREVLQPVRSVLRRRAEALAALADLALTVEGMGPRERR